MKYSDMKCKMATDHTELQKIKKYVQVVWYCEGGGGWSVGDWEIVGEGEGKRERREGEGEGGGRTRRESEERDKGRGRQ